MFYVYREANMRMDTRVPQETANAVNADFVPIIESHSTEGIAGTPERLTSRETEVLRLMAAGLTTKAIANGLGIAFKTAACHRARILQKLDCESTVLAVRWAIRNGVVVA
jgi:DNA-binding NarL/FixJ family response regulator